MQFLWQKIDKKKVGWIPDSDFFPPGVCVCFEESNAEKLEDDEAQETQENEDEKVINEDEESGRPVVPLLDFGIVHFFELRHWFRLAAASVFGVMDDPS